MRRQVDEVDIDRKAQHVADEKIDRGAALEREAILGPDDRQHVQQQRDLPAIGVSERHPNPRER